MTNQPQQPNQQPYPENYPRYEEDEINLIDCLRVLWKWKWLIIGGTLVCAIAAAVISLQMPRIYEISAVIEPGIVGIKNDGNFIYIDSVANMGGKIGERAYDRKIQEALRLDPLKVGVNFKSAIVEKTNLIRITSQWQEKDIDLGAKVVRELIHFLSDDYKKIVKNAYGSYSNKIIAKQSELNWMVISEKQERADAKNLWQKKEELLQAKKKVEENMNKIIHQRELLLRSKKTGHSSTLLLYSTTIQRNLTYFNQISSELYELNIRENEIKTKIEKFPGAIADIKAQINTLNLEKELISDIKIIQEPAVSLFPVKPKKKKLVLLAGVVALFIFAFLSFFIEYIKNATLNESKGVRRPLDT